MMTFQPVITNAVADNNNPYYEKLLARAKSHPRVWAAYEHLVAHKFERENGGTLPANFDWSTIAKWVMANLPQILMLLVRLLPLFAL